MRHPSACVGGVASASDHFATQLRREGFEIESRNEHADLDLAVFLEAPAGETGAAASAGDRWLDAAVDALTDAFDFARATTQRLARRSGVFAVVTTLAGDLGVPGRSLDAVISAGVGALTLSAVHEVRAISAVRIAISTPPPAPPRASADVPWPAERRPDADTWARIAVLLGRLIANEDLRRPGSLVTLTSIPVA